MSNSEANKFKCLICDAECGIRGFGMHLKHKHQMTYKDYHDAYLKKEGEGVCLTCGGETAFLKGNYNQFCSIICTNKNSHRTIKRTETYILTLKDNPEIAERRNEKLKQIWANNPDIAKCMSDKSKETYRKNPEISKRRAIKQKQTLKDNPEIVERRVIKQKRTLKDNPEITENGLEKRRETYRNNPEIMDKLSISVRNYYKSITENDTEESHYFYIMENQTKPIIKIGLCSESSLKRRTKEITGDFGESKHVLLLKASYKKIDELETFLHGYFKEHCRVQPEKKSGRTEWFDIKIMEEAIELASSKLEQIT